MKVAWLSDSSDAAWIVPGEPFRLAARSAGPREAVFRRTFELASPASPTLSFKALKVAKVLIDGRPVFSGSEGSAALGALAAGPHELKVAVLNVDGPDALRVPAGDFWEASRDDETWAPASLASARPVPELAQRYGSPARALASSWPALALVFAFVFAWSWSGRKFRAGWIRYVCLAAFLGLWLRDAPRLPLEVGFDVKGHLDYMRFLLERRALPAPADGWQMFQAPLYYILALPAFAASSAALLRVIPLLCGLAQIELSWRAARRLFPARPDLHATAAVLGGLMPMSLYLNLEVGNEPLAAALSAGALVAALYGSWAWTGAALGLALLTKANALLAVLPAAALLVAASKRRWKDAGRAFGLAALISGWFYVRQWALTGSFAALASYGRVSVVGDAAGWWQDPGYRCWPQLWSFGRALSRPAFAATAGFGDSLYSTAWLDGLMSSMASFETRPPWNMDYLLSLAWLSLFPCALILLGMARSAKKKPFGLLAAAVALYIAAVLALWLRLPIYSAAKATYTAGLIPFYAVLGCLGLEALGKKRLPLALARGWLAAWAACSWLAFYIR